MSRLMGTNVSVRHVRSATTPVALLAEALALSASLYFISACYGDETISPRACVCGHGHTL